MPCIGNDGGGRREGQCHDADRDAGQPDHRRRISVPSGSGAQFMAPGASGAGYQP